MDKKQRFVIISDVHGFYDEMMEALNKVKFNPETDCLISLGDNIDRGPKPASVIKYLMDLPRKILVKGNHCQLFEELCEREFPYSYDNSNGTTRTVWQLGLSDDFQECCSIALHRTKPFFNEMVNYFETKNYIFVHSWVPVINKDGLPAHYTRGRNFDFNQNWRNVNDKEWEDSRWGNPFDMAARGLNQTGKTIVFGHWHCSTGWAEAEGRSEFGEDAKFEPYYGDGFISIDACTAHSGKVNVIVIEDELLEE
jgi:serine/threonine protein phosphatase 1